MNLNVILEPQIIVLVAGEIRRIHAYANFITILDNSASSQIYIAIGDRTAVPLYKGLQYELPQGANFTHIDIQNQAAVATTVSLILSNGRVYDNRLVLADELSVKSVTNQILTAPAIPVGIAIPAVAQAPIFPATVREVHYCNTGAFEIWYGDSTVDPANKRGIPIQSMQPFVLPSSCRPYFAANGGASVISINYFNLV